MKTYREWSPTGFDMRGLNLHDRQEWSVAPCILTRDSDNLETSNWHAIRIALRDVDPSGDTWEEHAFNHWACGWFAIILVRPASAAHTTAEDCERRLCDYPILDENDYSEREAVDAEGEET
jgi:hypothetical protein